MIFFVTSLILEWVLLLYIQEIFWNSTKGLAILTRASYNFLQSIEKDWHISFIGLLARHMWSFWILMYLNLQFIDQDRHGLRPWSLFCFVHKSTLNDLTPLCTLIILHYLKIIFLIGPVWNSLDRLCGLVARVLGYRSGGPGSIPGTTKKKN
jgi:hypothetical protein